MQKIFYEISLKEIADLKLFPEFFKTELFVKSKEIESKDVQPDDMEKVLKLLEESICPVWSMVKNNVEISCKYKIINNMIKYINFLTHMDT